MRRVCILAIPVIAALVALAAAGASSVAARARTPTPSITPTIAPSATPTPTPGPEQFASFDGQAWVDARMASGPITAKIGDRDCGQATGISPPCDPACTVFDYSLRVPSSQLKPGCGKEGDTITFFVEGKQAWQTATWHASSNEFLRLIAGPPFATVWGGFAGTPDLPTLNYPYTEEKSLLIPYIGGVACGYDDYFWCVSGGCEYSTVVYSNEQRQGCGYEGAPITFKLLDNEHNVKATALQRATWHAWDGSESEQSPTNLTFVTPSGIRLGSVGTGDSRCQDAVPFEAMLGLALAGAVSLATGAALRRKRV